MSVLHAAWPYIAALIPFLGGLFVFYVIMRHIVESDRRERIAQRKWEAEHEHRPGGADSGDSTDHRHPAQP